MASGKTLQARISKQYAGRLDEIARVFVEEGERYLPTARRCRAELGMGLAMLTLRSWDKLAKPEWVAAVERAREAKQIAERAVGNLRGQKFLDWCRETEAKLRERYQALAQDESLTAKDLDEAKTKLEARILRLAEAARAEERHLEDQRQAEAIRSMAAFGKKLLKALADCGLPEAAVDVLNRVAKNPVGFMKDEL